MFNASLMNQSVCDRATSRSQSQAADFVFCYCDLSSAARRELNCPGEKWKRFYLGYDSYHWGYYCSWSMLTSALLIFIPDVFA